MTECIRKTLIDTHIYETSETEGHYPFNDHPECTRPCPWGPNTAGVLHHVDNWDTHKVPDGEDG
jgi:hypothetical protein